MFCNQNQFHHRCNEVTLRKLTFGVFGEKYRKLILICEVGLFNFILSGLRWPIFVFYGLICSNSSCVLNPATGLLLMEAIKGKSEHKRAFQCVFV